MTRREIREQGPSSRFKHVHCIDSWPVVMLTFASTRRSQYYLGWFCVFAAWDSQADIRSQVVTLEAMWHRDHFDRCGHFSEKPKQKRSCAKHLVHISDPQVAEINAKPSTTVRIRCSSDALNPQNLNFLNFGWEPRSNLKCFRHLSLYCPRHFFQSTSSFKSSNGWNYCSIDGTLTSLKLA